MEVLDPGEDTAFFLDGDFLLEAVVPRRLGLVLPEEDSLLDCLFIFLACPIMSPTLLMAFAALLIEGRLGVVPGESTSLVSWTVSTEGAMEDLLLEGLLLLLFSRFVSDFFLSSIIFLCIFPTNRVGVGAGSRFSRERIFSSGARGLGVGVASGFVAFVT